MKRLLLPIVALAFAASVAGVASAQPTMSTPTSTPGVYKAVNGQLVYYMECEIEPERCERPTVYPTEVSSKHAGEVNVHWTLEFDPEQMVYGYAVYLHASGYAMVMFTTQTNVTFLAVPPGTATVKVEARVSEPPWTDAFGQPWGSAGGQELPVTVGGPLHAAKVR